LQRPARDQNTASLEKEARDRRNETNMPFVCVSLWEENFSFSSKTRSIQKT